MKKLLPALVIIVSAFLAAGTYPRSSGIVTAPRTSIGFNLAPSANSGLITFAVLTWYDEKDDRPDRVQYITRQEFLSIAHGLVDSKANPHREDLFVKHEVQDCNYFIDTVFRKTTFECSIVDDLWRLRYNMYPVKVNNPPKGSGWATTRDEMSWGQLDYLGKYGIKHRNDFFYGENAFKLLKDMQNPDWISEYSKK